MLKNFNSIRNNLKNGFKLKALQYKNRKHSKSLLHNMD
jgi:hypothetical protein